MFGDNMREVLSGKDIKTMISEIQEKSVSEIKLFSGEDSRKKIILAPGFKLQEPKSGLIYTVMSIIKSGNDFYLKCQRGDGTVIKIPESDLKLYNRL
tara:strand:+ start:6312 stop:6602 length:291 start_codon:yes stop_codon:yes gene_type:complete